MHPSVPGRVARRLPIAFCVLLSAASLGAATITVNDTGDAIAVDAKVTLREAITSIMNGSNVNADVSASGTYGVADEIDFAIGSGLQAIVPGSALPTIAKKVKLDGTTQPGFAGSPLIQLQGNLAGGTTDGLTLSNHSGSVIRGLIIILFGGDGILVRGTGGGHVIAGNWIGLTAVPGGNSGNGITIEGVANNRIGGTVAADRNVVSANLGHGIELSGAGATDNLVEGNFIGLDPGGTLARGNSSLGSGVAIDNDAGLNTIGGTAAGAGNVISGNNTATMDGVWISAGSGNVIQGNWIGTNAAGTAGVPNARKTPASIWLLINRTAPSHKTK